MSSLVVEALSKADGCLEDILKLPHPQAVAIVEPIVRKELERELLDGELTVEQQQSGRVLAGQIVTMLKLRQIEKLPIGDDDPEPTGLVPLLHETILSNDAKWGDPFESTGDRISAPLKLTANIDGFTNDQVQVVARRVAIILQRKVWDADFTGLNAEIKCTKKDGTPVTTKSTTPRPTLRVQRGGKSPLLRQHV